MSLVAAGLAAAIVTAGGEATVGTAEQARPGVVAASRSGEGTKAVAIEVEYKVRSADGSVPGAIAVYVHPEGDPAPGDRILVNRIFPFAPAGPDGLRRATVSVPESLAGELDERPVVVEIAFDSELTAAPPAANTLSLEAATIVNGAP